MLPIIIAMLLALAPQPKLAESDDFNDVIAMNEKVTHCEAVRLYKGEPDDIRVVIFSCADGEMLVPFVLQGEEGWFPAQRRWVSVKQDVKGSSI